MIHSIRVLALTGVLGCASWPSGAASLETVSVGNPGNLPDTRVMSTDGSSGYGQVDYAFRIGKYEVTAGQYSAFLNAIAGVDTYGLYNIGMEGGGLGCGIARSGGGTSANPYSYAVDPTYVNRPVICVKWGDAARFANWLHNGQPTGTQGAATTETGAYTLNGATSLEALAAVQRNPGALWAITSENEWYKAAYYDPTLNGGAGGYWRYPTRSNIAPGQDMADASGNNANYYVAPFVYPIQPGLYTTVVGQFQNSVSYYGTFDQAGNAWEWNESLIFDVARGRRGGSYNLGGFQVEADWRDWGGDPTAEITDFGFRVSQVPEPTLLTLLAIGALSLRRRPRRERREAMG